MNLNPTDPIEYEDRRILFEKILQQALTDYIMLMLPRKRRRGFLEEHFRDAAEMFFDDEFRFESLKNAEGEELSLVEFLTEIGQSHPDIETLQETLVTEAKEYWDQIEMAVIQVPNIITIDGQVFQVLNKSNSKLEIDFDTRIISFDFNENLQENFMNAVLMIMCDINEINMKLEKVSKLSQSLLRFLKLNNIAINE